MNSLETDKQPTKTAWSAPAFDGFDPDQALIWGGEFDQLIGSVPDLEILLSEDEQRRSRSFRFDKHRRQFIVARGVLRLLTGQYQGVNPKRLQFTYNAYGKPHLSGSWLSFNLSHSGNRLLYGFSVHQPIGVDVELVRGELYDYSIAQNYFTPGETEILKQFPAQAVENFYTYWSCKEAVLKGMGKGITEYLQEIDLAKMAGELTNRFTFCLSGHQAEVWEITRLTHLPGYAAAVALKGANKRLVYRELTRETIDSLLQQADRWQ